MHFLLLILRLVLGLVAQAWRDSLTLAARADGRIEHLPARPRLWGRWLSRLGHSASRRGPGTLGVRAKEAPRRAPRSADVDSGAER